MRSSSNTASASMEMRRNSASLTACLVCFLFVLALESHVTTVSKSDSNSMIVGTQGKKRLELISRGEWDPEPEGRQIICDRTHENYDICQINGPAVLDPKSSTFFLLDPVSSLTENIRPYPRKAENSTMKRIKELTITSGPLGPKCEAQHNVPALVFSAGGYTGNFWHEFNDGFIPLFITANTVFPNQEFVLVISKARDWWVSKYAELLRAFSKHPIINLDEDTTTHCFTSATIGLISHGFMSIKPTLLPTSKNFTHFRALLDKAYAQVPNHLPTPDSRFTRRPRLALTSRKGSIGRDILNEAQIKRVAQEIGFDVIIFKPKPGTPLHQAYALINSSHAMIGVHGAALTHSLFMRPGAVFVQVVPLGLGWVSEVCFGTSARAMGLEYMEYNINPEESSLIDKYDKNDLLIKDPVAYRGKNWSDAIMNIYLKEQNVRLDLVRFKEYMKDVYKKAKKLMNKERGKFVTK